MLLVPCCFFRIRTGGNLFSVCRNSQKTMNKSKVAKVQPCNLTYLWMQDDIFFFLVDDDFFYFFFFRFLSSSIRTVISSFIWTSFPICDASMNSWNKLNCLYFKLFPVQVDSTIFFACLAFHFRIYPTTLWISTKRTTEK